MPGTIQIQKKGGRRPPRPHEALALVLGALGTLNRLSGVQTMNAEMNGETIAMALIPGAQFGEDVDGNTTLDTVCPLNWSE